MDNITGSIAPIKTITKLYFRFHVRGKQMARTISDPRGISVGSFLKYHRDAVKAFGPQGFTLHGV